jgi:preprotein translocase subunit SecD
MSPALDSIFLRATIKNFTIDGKMREILCMTYRACLVVFLFAGIPQTLAQLSIRAASADPVEGWQKMNVEHSNRVAWVAPTEALTANDIEKARPELDRWGDTRIVVVFTEAGAKKMRDLTIAQKDKAIALVVDGKLMWCPIVRSEFSGKESALTGALTQEEVDRILAIFR